MILKVNIYCSYKLAELDQKIPDSKPRIYANHLEMNQFNMLIIKPNFLEIN